ncbi:MAG: NAD(P)H-dependent glycerol-3-phosphate dehydrogenase [Pseudomonadota bacterium]
MQKVGVIGAGAWGTALALCAARAGRDVALWARDGAATHKMQAARVNETYLPDILLPENLQVTADSSALASCDILLAAIPAQQLVVSLQVLQKYFSRDVPVVLCAKGIDYQSGAFLTDQLAAALPAHKIGILSGPGFAQDVARGLPVAVTLAFEDMKLGEKVAQALSSSSFRPYFSTDVRGVEIGGALKNVFAIAAGIVMGRKLGVSSRAAIVTRSFAEMQRFGAAFGAKPETFHGLSGLGDLMLTATSEQSRNFRFGFAIGEGVPLAEAKQKLGTVEGIATAHAARLIAKNKNIEMPITETIGSIMDGDETIDGAIAKLMARPLKAEGQ